MNDTPETDAHSPHRYGITTPDGTTTHYVPADFARKLERERDEARNTARWLYQHGIATLIEGASRNEWIKEEIK